MYVCAYAVYIYKWEMGFVQQWADSHDALRPALMHIL